MFNNLKAEMARKGYRSKDMAEILGISRQSFEYKMRTGKFKLIEAVTLCNVFSCDFNYLFDVKLDHMPSPLLLLFCAAGASPVAGRIP